MRRRNGTIERRRGIYRARMRVHGKMEEVGSFATEAEAEAALVLFAEGVAKDSPTAGESLASWGRKWLDARELDGVHRSVSRDRHTWKRAARSKFIDLPLAAITVRDIREWIAAQVKEGAARQTICNALNLLRVCLESACEDGLISVNPARDIRVPKMARTADAWTFLKLEEIDKLLGENVDEEQRDIFTVKIYTGLRAGELCGLEWPDVDLRARMATIRYSWKRTPTKRGIVRTVNLFGPVVAALERQKKRSGRRTKVFPAADGEARTRDQTPDLASALKAAGIKRHVRLHDLRHTCASHLVSGSWGRAWTLEEIAKHLGHVSSASTRRYAHLCPEGLARAVRETDPEAHTRVIRLVPQLPPNVPQGAIPGAQQAKAKHPESLAEEARFERAVTTPRRFSKRHGPSIVAPSSDEKGTIGGRAHALLASLQAGECSAADVARVAAEVLSNPPPVIAAAQRYLASVGTPGEGVAAVAFLDLAARYDECALLWSRIEGDSGCR